MANDTETSVEINGYVVRVIRILMGISSSQQLAESIGKTDAYVRMIETGRSKRVSAETYRALMGALSIKDYRALLANPHASDATAPGQVA